MASPVGSDVLARVRAAAGRIAPTPAMFAATAGLNPERFGDAVAGRLPLTSLHLAVVADTARVTVDWLLDGSPAAFDRDLARARSCRVVETPGHRQHDNEHDTAGQTQPEEQQQQLLTDTRPWPIHGGSI